MNNIPPSHDRETPVAAILPLHSHKSFNPLVDEVLPAHISPPSLSLPDEIVIQSVPIKTAVTFNSSQTPQTLKFTNNDDVGIKSNNLFNTLPIKLLNPQHLNQHLFDGAAAQTSEKDLVTFIQKLMDQAKKEQNDLVLSDISPFLSKKQVAESGKLNSSVSQDKNKDTSNQIMEKTIKDVPSTASTSTEKVAKTFSSTTTTTSTVSSSQTTVTAPTLPFRTTLRTSTEAVSVVSTTDSSPQGVITRLLGEAAAPIAGLSAATLAYSAAAMLPVWLPAALAGRKKKSFEANWNLQDIQAFKEQKDMFKQR